MHSAKKKAYKDEMYVLNVFQVNIKLNVRA